MLRAILERKQQEVLRKRKSLYEALSQGQRTVIAEIKRASPSQGKIAKIPDVVERAKLYVEGGASALSVLTDSAFEGSLDDLKEISKALAATPVPVLRKDFIIHPIQLFEALALGADAVLLIVSVLQGRTGEFLRLAEAIGLEALVEVHTAEELEIAKAIGAQIIGVNQRDLRDFSLHPERFSELIDKIPEHCVAVAESGLSVPAAGYDALLVGTALSRAEEPLALLAQLRGAPCL